MSIDEELLKENLEEYGKRLKSWQKNIKGTHFNKEQNAIVKFVVPLLNMLGWDSLSKDIEFEYHMRDKKSKRGRNVDIALYLSNTDRNMPKILIEVEPLQNELRHGIKQIFKHYLRNSKTSFGVVTNGRQLNFYHKYRQRHDTINLRPLFSFESMEDFINYRDVLLLLSRDMVAGGMLDKFASIWHRPHIGYFAWKKNLKTRNVEKDNYALRLTFARDLLTRLDNY